MVHSLTLGFLCSSAATTSSETSASATQCLRAGRGALRPAAPNARRAQAAAGRGRAPDARAERLVALRAEVHILVLVLVEQHGEERARGRRKVPAQAARQGAQRRDGLRHARHVAVLHYYLLQLAQHVAVVARRDLPHERKK